MALSGIQGERPFIERAPAGPAAPSVARSPVPETNFARALRGLAGEIDRGERHFAGAAELQSYDTRTLIALQVGIYRYTEAVDLASKIVDRATNAVRTVLQGGGH